MSHPVTCSYKLQMIQTFSDISVALPNLQEVLASFSIHEPSAKVIAKKGANCAAAALWFQMHVTLLMPSGIIPLESPHQATSTALKAPPQLCQYFSDTHEVKLLTVKVACEESLFQLTTESFHTLNFSLKLNRIVILIPSVSQVKLKSCHSRKYEINHLRLHYIVRRKIIF